MFFEVVLAVVSSLLTAKLINEYKKCPVQASSLVTLTLCLLVTFFTKHYSEFFPIIFAASFIGMSSYSKFSKWEIVMAAIIMSLTHQQVAAIVPTLGGVLGFCAFVSLLLVKLFTNILKMVTKPML